MVRTGSSKMLEEYPALSAVPGPQEALQASVPNVKAGMQAGKKRAGRVHRQLIKPKPLLAGGVGAFSLSLGIQGPRVSG